MSPAQSKGGEGSGGSAHAGSTINHTRAEYRKIDARGQTKEQPLAPAANDYDYVQDLGHNVKLLEDDSSYIAYGGEKWGTDHRADSLTSRYRTSTFHGSNKASSWALVTWNGGDIGVYGAKRDNHGYYAVTIDNGPMQYFDGYAAVPEFQIALFESTGLEDGMHQLLIVNENRYNASTTGPDRNWLDIDYVKLTGTPVDSRFATMPTGDPVEADAGAQADMDTASDIVLPSSTSSPPAFSSSSTESPPQTLSSPSSAPIQTTTSRTQMASSVAESDTFLPTSVVIKPSILTSSTTSVSNATDLPGSQPTNEATRSTAELHIIGAAGYLALGLVLRFLLL